MLILIVGLPHFLLFYDNSSEETRSRAERLATQIGASHMNLKIDTVVSALVCLFSSITGKIPRFKVRFHSPSL